MVLRTLRGCSPFIACGLISAFANWRVGTVVAVALSAALVVAAAREGGRPSAAVLEVSAVVFCGVAVVLAFVTPQAGIRAFVGSLSTGWLALTAWTSVALARPFTAAAEPEAAATGGRTQRVLSAIWAAGFTATALVLLAVESAAPHSGYLELLVQLAGNFAPALAAHRYALAARNHA